MDKIKPVFISVKILAVRWSTSPSCIYMHRGGTEKLTRYRFGRSIKFLLSEVEAVEKKIIEVEERNEKSK